MYHNIQVTVSKGKNETKKQKKKKKPHTQLSPLKANQIINHSVEDV
jgi:hypothetical protein